MAAPLGSPRRDQPIVATASSSPRFQSWLAAFGRPTGERILTCAVLLVISAVAWKWLVDMAAMRMSPPTIPWHAEVWILTFVMWVVMMVAMMLPTATPMILTFVTVNHRRPARHRMLRNVAPSFFLVGYLIAWTGFSAVATVSQWLLALGGQIDHLSALRSSALIGLLLIGVGVYQLTPLKAACARACQSPLGFLLTSWRDGLTGAFRMGLRHGLSCIGCCWALMALMFVGGVMSLLWMAGLTVFVLIEKLSGRITWLWRGAGVLLVGVGLGLLTHSLGVG